MQGIKDRVAIVGMGCSKFGEMWDKSDEDLMVDACYEALEDAGLESKDIQAAWYGTNFTGFTGQMLAHAIKLEYIPVTRVENACATATDAFRNAAYAVAAGIYDIVLACGVDKLKDTGYTGLDMSRFLPDGSKVAMTPRVPPPSQFALSAVRYFHEYGLSYDEGKRILAMIAAKNHHNGTLSPKAHFQREITVEQALNAPMIAYPLGLFDCCGVSDGSAAAIITTPEIAKRLRKDKDHVLVKGLGVSVGARQGTLQDTYDFVHFEENVMAAKMAYTEAGINNPREEIKVASVHDCFTITELIIYEDLGFSPRGKGKDDVEAGTFTLQGKLPVNTDGGLKCFGHPVGASGLRMIYEVYKQIQGKAGLRQIKNVDIGLTHNLGGVPGSFTSAVCILGAN
ncbi:MAG: acetyl-CoA acetyltransferase [Dehalococcoidia bacterium]|nr:acetyl-CoA acetyltransferase [Dehalococcoidia bacterium]